MDGSDKISKTPLSQESANQVHTCIYKCEMTYSRRIARNVRMVKVNETASDFYSKNK